MKFSWHEQGGWWLLAWMQSKACMRFITLVFLVLHLFYFLHDQRHFGITQPITFACQGIIFFFYFLTYTPPLLGYFATVYFVFIIWTLRIAFIPIFKLSRG